MDNNAWRINDPEWVRERERLWQNGLAQYVRAYAIDRELDVEKFLENARLYFDGQKIEYPMDPREQHNNVTWRIRILLHPNPSVDTIREILMHLAERANLNVAGYVSFYKVIQSEWAPLIKQGLLPENIIDNFMVALYGRDFEEAIVLRHVDPEKDLYWILENLIPYVLGWLANASVENVDCDYFPHTQLLTQFIGMLKRVQDHHLDDLRFSMRRLFRFLPKFEESETAHLPRRVEFVQGLRQALVENREAINPGLWPYFDGDPAVLARK